MRKYIELICGAVVLLAPMMSTEAAAQGTGFTAIAGCRVLDTRALMGDTDPEAWEVPGAKAISVHLSNEAGDIPKQGGDAGGCTDVPASASAYVVTLSSFVEGFGNFSGLGYATLVPWDDTDWTEDVVTVKPAGIFNVLYDYTTGTFAPAASLVFDDNTKLITNTTTVASCDHVVDETCTWNVLLYTSGQAHFTIDVVGYYDPIVP